MFQGNIMVISHLKYNWIERNEAHWSNNQRQSCFSLFYVLADPSAYLSVSQSCWILTKSDVVVGSVSTP